MRKQSATAARTKASVPDRSRAKRPPEAAVARTPRPPGDRRTPADRLRRRRRTGLGPACGMFGCKRGNYTAMVTFIVVLIIVGLIAGAVARLLVPGRDPIGLIGTILLGIVGSFLGGFIENLIQFHRLAIHRVHTTGIIGSIIGAIVLLLILRVTGVERGRSRSRI